MCVVWVCGDGKLLWFFCAFSACFSWVNTEKASLSVAPPPLLFRPPVTKIVNLDTGGSVQKLCCVGHGQEWFIVRLLNSFTCVLIKTSDIGKQASQHRWGRQQQQLLYSFVKNNKAGICAVKKARVKNVGHITFFWTLYFEKNSGVISHRATSLINWQNSHEMNTRFFSTCVAFFTTMVYWVKEFGINHGGQGPGYQ